MFAGSFIVMFITPLQNHFFKSNSLNWGRGSSHIVSWMWSVDYIFIGQNSALVIKNKNKNLILFGYMQNVCL